MVEMDPVPEGISIEVEVCPEQIDRYATGLNAEEKKEFLNQFRPRLALLIERETEEYLEFALSEFAKSKEQANE